MRTLRKQGDFLKIALRFLYNRNIDGSQHLKLRISASDLGVSKPFHQVKNRLLWPVFVKKNYMEQEAKVFQNIDGLIPIFLQQSFTRSEPGASFIWTVVTQSMQPKIRQINIKYF